MVFHMLNEDPGNITYNDIGGLNEQIRELREVASPFSFIWDFSWPGHRAASQQPGAVRACRDQASQRRAALWPARNWKDTSRQSTGS